MILKKLSKMEMEITKVIADEQRKMDVIKTVKELLNQIDLSVEVIPEGNALNENCKMYVKYVYVW
jgi:hypothetical protein